MSFIRVMSLAGRIVRQFVRDRRTLALLFLAPLLVMTLLQIVLNSSDSSVTLAIVPPSGPLGATIVSNIKLPDSISLKIITADQAEPGLTNGDYDGVLIFPSDFLAQVQQGQRPELELRLEGSNPTVAKQLSNIVTLLVNSLATAQPSSTQAAVTPTLTDRKSV